ncbi:MAG: helix-hairpin-helix domain-containing protein [Stecheria intestinalis]|nr:helix-hairpin-helix domain-containing protein [Stecheria intestinalis]
MTERESASVEGRFFRRRNQEGSDFFVNLVTCQSGRELPPAVQNQGKFAHGFIFTVTGYNLPTVKELKYRYYGSWVMSPKYGLQFEAKSCREIPPDTRSGIAAYLASSRFHRIGKASARAIVDRFGLETLEVIRNTPEQLLEVRGVTRSRLASLLKSFHETESYGELAAFLGAFRIRSDRIAKIYECWGQSSEARIRENPYALTEISGISFPMLISSRMSCSFPKIPGSASGQGSLRYLHRIRPKAISGWIFAS